MTRSLRYPGMEPTNNLGEQAMREQVIIRKIIGCFRSEKRKVYYPYSCIVYIDEYTSKYFGDYFWN